MIRDILNEHEQRIRPKGNQTTIGGETVNLGSSNTVETDQGDSFLGKSHNGIPRDEDAFAAKQLGQTAIAESVKNIIISQLTGGELAFPMDSVDDDETPDEIQTLREFFRDLLEGPHLADDDWDDLVAAAVSDMADIGNAYWEVIPSKDGSLPVASLKPVAALSVKHNVDKNGAFEEPAYYQAPVGIAGGSFTTAGATPQELERDELITMRWPGSRRAGRTYPMAPMMQVKEWLELLMNSTTSHGRYYDDNEIPAGFLQVMSANQTDIDRIKVKMQEAAGDPHSAPVIGGDGPANWIEMGGQAINLDVIQEQQWFINLVLGAFGIPKQELSLVEDVNRSTSSEQASMIYKRVTKPVSQSLTDPVERQLLPQFDAYSNLSRELQFGCKIAYSDPQRERAQEEHVRARFEAGGMSYNEYRQLLGEDPGETVVLIDGAEVDYGPHPWPVVQELFAAARGDPPTVDQPSDDDGEQEDE